MAKVEDDQKPIDKSAQFIIDELTAVCNSLGKLDENDGTYMKDRDCKPCLREIQRYLNADSKHHTARCTLGSYNIIKSDLIPLLVQYCDFNDGDSELFNTILRLCTNITSSVLLIFKNEQDSDEKEEQRKLENQILNGLFGYKEAFAQSDQIWSMLNTHLRHNREDDLTFERLIILIRNILHIPVDSRADMGVHADFDVHDMCIYRMEKSGMLETIVQICSDTQKGPEFCFHLTEIMYLILRDQNPETISKAKPCILKKRLDDQDADKKLLAELSARNRKEREKKMRGINPLRLRGPTFVVQNIRGIGDQPLVINKPLVAHREDISFDRGKTQLRKARNKKPLPSETSMKFSDLNTKTSRNSYSLKIFCEQIVKNVYNNYMNQIKHNLIQKKNQENDESYYLWAIQFFTAFCRHSKMGIDSIAETLSTSTLHFIQVLINSYQEKIKMEKKEYHDTSKRLHLALRAYREILILIKAELNNPDYSEKIKSIKTNVFTENDYATLLLGLFQHFEEQKHSSHFLEDLIQTNHIFLEVLNDYSAEESTKSSFLYKYCCPDVVKWYAYSLKKYKNNKDLTNKAILALFEKIVATENDVVLFQASLFRTLFSIIEYDENYKALTVKLISKFGKMANKKRWMFQELLFWKTGNDVIEIENAIDPPPAPVMAPQNEEPMDLLFEAVDESLPPESQLPAGDSQRKDEQQVLNTLDELRAELWDSDDDNDVQTAAADAFKNENEPPVVDVNDEFAEGKPSERLHPASGVVEMEQEDDRDEEEDEGSLVATQKRKTQILESDSDDSDSNHEDEIAEPSKASEEQPLASEKEHPDSNPLASVGDNESNSSLPSVTSELPDGDDIDELKGLLASQEADISPDI